MKTDDLNPQSTGTSVSQQFAGFTATLTILMLASIVVSFLWWIAYAGFGLSPAPAGLTKFTGIVTISWMIYQGIIALINYAIALFFTAIGEMVAAFVTQTQLSSDETPVEGPTEQRDDTVTYLHDLLKRPRQVDPDAPLPPTAA